MSKFEREKKLLKYIDRYLEYVPTKYHERRANGNKWVRNHMRASNYFKFF